MTDCKNCENSFEGKYCPECGQKASVKRFSTKILFSQLMDKLLPLDRGVLFTARMLLTQPAAMLRGYLDGKRVGYTKPFQFLLLTTALSMIFFSVDQFQQGLHDGWGSTNDTRTAEMLAYQDKLAGLITKNMTLLVVGMIPVIAMVGRWFYKKHKVNFAEHVVLNCYMVSAGSIICSPLLFAAKFLGGENMLSNRIILASTFLYVAFYVWTFSTLFPERNRLWTWIKAAVTYIFAYLLYIVIFGMIVSIVTVVYIILHKKGLI